MQASSVFIGFTGVMLVYRGPVMVLAIFGIIILYPNLKILAIFFISNAYVSFS